MIQNNQSQLGFIALTSVVIISAVLIIIGASIGYTGFFTRFNVLDGEFKDLSLGLAEACTEIARAEIANNANYNPTNEVRNIGSGIPQPTCTIVSVTKPGSYYLIKAQGVYNNSYSNISAEVNRQASNVAVITWKEVANF